MSSGEMDTEKLPTRVLLDTGVFLRALGDRKDEEVSADCRDFLKAMLEARRDLIIAAPSYAEFLRGREKAKPPLVRNLVVLPFDMDAARRLGEDFPEELLVQHKSNHAGSTLSYYKYDALIVATGVRWGAKAIITLDKGMKQLALNLGVRAAAPSDFRKAQLRLAIADQG